MRTWVGVMLSLLVGCGAQGGAGALTVRLSGEEGAKEGFPVEEDGESIAFADGWNLKFTKYLVSVGRLSITATDGDEAVLGSELYLVDLAPGDPVLETFTDLNARRWDRFSFDLVAPTDAAKLVNVSQADRDRMVAGGFNYWVEGTATKGGRMVTFAWGLKSPTRNTDCTNGDDGKAGIVVRENSTAEAEITFHVEHLFWDALGHEDAALRFDAIAAMANEEGVVTLDALADQSLAQPVDEEGEPLVDGDGKPVVYDPGSTALAEDNLRGFVHAAIASQAHLNGEGLCTVSRL